MKKNSAGFTLIELMIATLVAGFIAAGLMTTIAQSSRLAQFIANIASSYSRIAIAQNQMERDLMGAFVPAQVDVMKTSTLKKEQIKPLDKIFYGVSKDNGQLDELTFITGNPLEIFFGIKDVSPKPRAARIVYRLVQDEKRKNSYNLTRQEGTQDLSYSNFKKDSTGSLMPFIMVEGIESLQVKYVAVQSPDQAEKKESKRVYKRENNWNADPSAQKDKPEKKSLFGHAPQPKLPHQIEVKLALWDLEFQTTTNFSFTIPIMYKASEYDEPPKKEPEKKSSEQTAENKDVAQVNNKKATSKQ